jgi:hypothetical protein
MFDTSLHHPSLTVHSPCSFQICHSHTNSLWFSGFYSFLSDLFPFFRFQCLPHRILYDVSIPPFTAVLVVSLPSSTIIVYCFFTIIQRGLSRHWTRWYSTRLFFLSREHVCRSHSHQPLGRKTHVLALRILLRASIIIHQQANHLAQWRTGMFEFWGHAVWKCPRHYSTLRIGKIAFSHVTALCSQRI